MQLSAAATAIRKRNTDAWPPATKAALELMAICRCGGGICDDEADPDLQTFVDLLRQLAAEPPAPVPVNRFERRRLAALSLPRGARLGRIH